MSSDPLSQMVLAQLIRNGVLDERDAEDIAGRLEEQGDEHAAHIARMAVIRAMEPTLSDWQAERRRNRFTVVPTPDGGNGTT